MALFTRQRYENTDDSVLSLPLMSSDPKCGLSISRAIRISVQAKENWENRFWDEVFLEVLR